VVVVVVIPLMVVETSLTTVLDELPLPPEPELPPADCEDDVADVDEVADVSDVDDVAEVDEAAEDDVEAVDGVAVTAAEDEAIALIDMKTSSEGDFGSAPSKRLLFHFNADRAEIRRQHRDEISMRAIGSGFGRGGRRSGCRPGLLSTSLST
jgi:hypothetical protein